MAGNSFFSFFSNPPSKKELWAIFGVWCLSTGIILSHVVPWSDEAHAWLIAYNLSWDQLFSIVPFEGHFFLWFSLLKVLACLHVPYPLGMQIFNWGISAVCIWLILFRAPFPRAVKYAIPFSYALWSAYPLLSRPYGLTVLLLFLLVMFFPKRQEHPFLYLLLIFLTAHSHLFGTIGAAGFGLLYLLDTWRAYQKHVFSATQFLMLAVVGMVLSEMLFGKFLDFALRYILQRLPFGNYFIRPDGW